MSTELMRLDQYFTDKSRYYLACTVIRRDMVQHDAKSGRARLFSAKKMEEIDKAINLRQREIRQEIEADQPDGTVTLHQAEEIYGIRQARLSAIFATVGLEPIAKMRRNTRGKPTGLYDSEKVSMVIQVINELKSKIS